MAFLSASCSPSLTNWARWLEHKLWLLINDTCSGKVKDDLINDMNNSFMEKDGTLYVFVTAHGFTIFPTQNGVKLSNVTEDSFTAVTNDSSDLDGQGKAEFVKSGDKWLIDSCSFE